jgi:hypothetical protein
MVKKIRIYKTKKNDYVVVDGDNLNPSTESVDGEND